MVDVCIGIWGKPGLTDRMACTMLLPPWLYYRNNNRIRSLRTKSDIPWSRSWSRALSGLGPRTASSRKSFMLSRRDLGLRRWGGLRMILHDWLFGVKTFMRARTAPWSDTRAKSRKRVWTSRSFYWPKSWTRSRVARIHSNVKARRR